MTRKIWLYFGCMLLLGLTILMFNHSFGQAQAFSSTPLVSTKITTTPNRLSGPVLAEVLEVIDGDTLSVRVQIWLGQSIETRVRLSGIDTPEIRGKCPHEKQLAQKARQELSNILKQKTVHLYNIRYGKYAGRILADAKNMTGQDVSEHLISTGFARVYAGKKRKGWCSA